MLKKKGYLVPYNRNPLLIKKAVSPGDELDLNKRYVTVSQLFVLLYHFYSGVTDPNIYYLDADETAEKFQSRINAEVEISKEDLEKLIYYTTLAHEEKTYWNPAKEEYKTFVKSLLKENEKFDQLMGLIVDKK